MIETGIFGGSFNPVHKGHISLAEHILTEAQLNEVWFVVSPLNPFKCKADDLLDDDKRLEMTRLALKDHPGLMASDYEFQLPRPSYTWKTLSHLAPNFKLNMELVFSLEKPSSVLRKSMMLYPIT